VKYFTYFTFGILNMMHCCS